MDFENDNLETLAPRKSGDASLPAKVWVVASGKGGVGKTFVSSSLGITLSKLGHSVVVVDLDLVNDVRIEREVRRPVRRLQQRVDAHDDSDGGKRRVRRLIRAVADERVQVRDVSLVVECSDGRFAVIRGECSRRNEQQLCQQQSRRGT